VAATNTLREHAGISEVKPAALGTEGAEVMTQLVKLVKIVKLVKLVTRY
jgi:hypothetical protein